jgi:hypothetical protein
MRVPSDESYGALKDAAVGAGLMIGQFHPACAEPAARNPAFPVHRRHRIGAANRAACRRRDRHRLDGYDRHRPYRKAGV